MMFFLHLFLYAWIFVRLGDAHHFIKGLFFE